MILEESGAEESNEESESGMLISRNQLLTVSEMQCLSPPGA
jgi:hypothetical protein